MKRDLVLFPSTHERMNKWSYVKEATWVRGIYGQRLCGQEGVLAVRLAQVVRRSVGKSLSLGHYSTRVSLVFGQIPLLSHTIIHHLCYQQISD